MRTTRRSRIMKTDKRHSCSFAYIPSHRFKPLEPRVFYFHLNPPSESSHGQWRRSSSRKTWKIPSMAPGTSILKATLFLSFFLFPVYMYNMAFLCVCLLFIFFFIWDVFVWIQVNKAELRGCNIKYCDQNKGFGVFSSNDVSDGNQNHSINLYIHICALYMLVVDWKGWDFVNKLIPFS